MFINQKPLDIEINCNPHGLLFAKIFNSNGYFSILLDKNRTIGFAELSKKINGGDIKLPYKCKANITLAILTRYLPQYKTTKQYNNCLCIQILDN